jgi:rhodanese-related sulfurtransferase
MSRHHSYALAILLILLTNPAWAIPPPDVLLSVWQSFLQVLGTVLALAAGAFFSLRQWFSIRTWSTKYLLRIISISVITISTITAFYFYNSHSAGLNYPTTTTQLPHGESLPINEVIQRELDDYIRHWKQKTLQEMQLQVTEARKAHQLNMPTLNIIPSFTPQALHDLRQKHDKSLYLVDTREAYERSQFNIGYDRAIRYADLIYGIVPSDLPHDKVIILLCHSGLRGYLASQFLKQAGYSNIAFLQGGLGAWATAKLPYSGNENYSYSPTHLRLFKQQDLNSLKAAFIQLDLDNQPIVGLKQVHRLPLELASSADIQQTLLATQPQALVIVCQTYAGCFHAANFAEIAKQAGRTVLGAYEPTGEFLK